ncbi:hypothetical protein AHAS_Ahas09G0102900 [Arachis hypogaea]
MCSALPPLLLASSHTFWSLCVVVLRLCPCELLRFHFNHNFRDERNVSARTFSIIFMFLSHFCSYHRCCCCLHSAPPLLLLLPPHHTSRSLFLGRLELLFQDKLMLSQWLLTYYD